ncbi:holo-[acyl-carrier-protein] synthase [Mycolicibacterium anyangense]|uniref:Holo-[acyl-carrier-protein] synthase n=1 Tax=Mycolicibacterium anyangense TaxID=1431246 RepID=A0A6N4WIZ8_9MYCO|nr:holo-ACP synthase [Mycolicibacterium anyangense]BBZ79852.1 holo-[acyl-carrier-protein] synthase [Mycolicibacterium anyangense]
MTDRIRVGCDLVELDQVAASIATFGDRYLQRVFTPAELDECAGSVARLAARFAAKEAVIKAFAAPEAHFSLRDIEICSTGSAPTLQLFGVTAERARQQGWTRTEVSLSHADCHAMAVVVVTCADTAS